MLTSNNSNTNTNSQDNTNDNDINMVSLSTSVDCWPTIELALNQLFSLPTEVSNLITLTSEDYLKLYTLVFDYCVGGTGGKNNVKENGAGLICGKDMYEAVFHYISHKITKWAEFIKTEQDPQQLFNHLLKQLNQLQSIEKPLTFIFTYLERHWIDRQINENCDNVLPMKQLIWSQWDKIILRNVLPRIQPVISNYLKKARDNQILLEDLEPIAIFVHYLRVISKPYQLESDYKSNKRVSMAGAVINKRAVHEDQFKEFVQWYCKGIEEDCPKLKIKKTINETNEFIQLSLQFWNEEEGRMAFLRFDKSALIIVRNHLKSLLLLPNLDLIKESFKESIVTWNLSTANTIYRLLANRKSLLLHLDTEAQTAFILKGQKLITEELTNQHHLNNMEEIERLFINLLGRFYNLTTELIQTSFAARPEIFESRSKAFRQLLNDPPIKNETQRKGFAARSLSKFADFIIRTFPDSIDKNNLQVLMALFRLIDDKEEFQETYGRLLALRLLTSITTKIPSIFESELLNHLKQTCGAFFVNNYERMFADIQEVEIIDHVTVITGGIWNIKGKLLPGNPLLLNHSDKFSWPEPINSSISNQIESYYQKFPKRKLFWSPVLSCVEFQYTYNDYSVLVKGTCVHLKILQTLSDHGPIAYDSLIKLSSNINANNSVPFYIPLVLNSLLSSGIVISISPDNILHLNSELSRDQDCLDLFTGVISELIGNNNYNYNNNNNNNNYYNNNNFKESKMTTPRPISSFAPHSFSNSSQHQQILNSLDKSILLQCAITRILKQLRLLSLPDLFNRISMLPNLLTRFSPSIEEIIEALKQLHEKEFVQLVFGDLDEFLDASESDLKNLSEFHDNLFIKYMA